LSQETIKPRDLEKYDVIRVTETNDRSFWDVLAGIEKRPTYEVQVVDVLGEMDQLLVLVFTESFMTNEQVLATRGEIASLVREADSVLVSRRILDGERLNTVWMRLSA
jgi:hypothetical protein